jgi:hypothetical protein
VLALPRLTASHYRLWTVHAFEGLVAVLVQMNRYENLFRDRYFETCFTCRALFPGRRSPLSCSWLFELYLGMVLETRYVWSVIGEALHATCIEDMTRHQILTCQYSLAIPI